MNRTPVPGSGSVAASVSASASAAERPRLAPRRAAGRAALRIAATGLASATLLFGLTACAPEPGETGTTGQEAKERMEQEESGKGGDAGTGSWPEENPEDVSDKHTDLPETFPGEAFPIPEGATIDDTGERAEGQWFVVLRAADAAAADALWNEVVAGGGFAVADETETAEGGRAATLTTPGYSVGALTFPQEDGSVLLSYDIMQTV